jgi:hypothetical protein
MRWLLVNPLNVVENIIIWDGSSVYDLPEGYSLHPYYSGADIDLPYAPPEV